MTWYSSDVAFGFVVMTLAGTDADEVRTERRAGGRPGAFQFLAQVEWDDPCRPLLVEVMREVGERHPGDVTGGDRVGGLAVFEVEPVARPPIAFA